MYFKIHHIRLIINDDFNWCWWKNKLKNKMLFNWWFHHYFPKVLAEERCIYTSTKNICIDKYFYRPKLFFLLLFVSQSQFSFCVEMIDGSKKCFWNCHENLVVLVYCSFFCRFCHILFHRNNVKHSFWEDLNSVLFSLTVEHVSNKKHLAFDTSKEIHEQRLLFWQKLSHSNEWIKSSAIKKSPWKIQT